jgi:hypothetical protein
LYLSESTQNPAFAEPNSPQKESKLDQIAPETAEKSFIWDFEIISNVK